VTLRSLGRWFYHAITSSEKRPFLQSSLEELEALATESSSVPEVFCLLRIFEELTYRITSAERRDRLKARIADKLLKLEGIRLPISSDRMKISEIRVQLQAKYKSQAEQEAAAEKARLEAEAKAQREAEEKEEKAKQEAERQAEQEAAAEKARLEAEAKAQREAEEKAKQEAESKNRMKTVVADIDARRKAVEEQRRIDKEEQKRIIEKQIQNFMYARPLSPESTYRSESNQIDETNLQSIGFEQEAQRKADDENQPALDTSEQNQQEKEQEEKQKASAEAVKKTLGGEAQSASNKQRIETNNNDQTEALKRSGIEDEDNQTKIIVKQDATSVTQSSKESSLQILEKRSREEEREERRELARIRKLEREAEKTNQAEYEQTEADLDEDIEQAEQFARFLRAIPTHWSDWSEQHWNIKLLDYCFAQKAGDNSSQGIPSTEEDLAFVTGDRESDPTEIAHTLVDRIRELSFNRGLSPARLLIQRLETWDYKSPQPPRYFAFLWTTCLIAQGFPSPFEKGEFHRRYERDNVYGSNETQFLSGNLPAAWDQLSKWLERDDIFDAKGHRRLELPKVDPRRSVISHSWKLSFPCRSDRKRLHEVLGKYRKGHDYSVRIDLHLISNICYQGGFTTEFTTALKQQIELLKNENHLEEWFSAIILREIEAQGKSQIQSASRGQLRGPIGMAPRIMLYLDDEDCYLELVLPGQSISIESQRRRSNKTYCTVTLETHGKMPRVVCELDIDDNQENLTIPDIRVKIHEEQEEYVLRLRHKGLDNAVLTEWSCAGLTKNHSYVLFNSETNEITSEKTLKGSSISFLFRQDWDVILSDGIESESEDPISVSKLGKWRLLLLTKTNPLENTEIITLANGNDEKIEINWVDSNDGLSSSKPLLKGLGLPGQSTRFIMLEESPDVWLPPGITDTQVEIFRIEDDEFYIPIGSIQVNSTESWQKAGVREILARPGSYAVRLSYSDNTYARKRKWSRHISLVEEPGISRLDPTPVQARYRFKETSKTLDLERNVTPFFCQKSQEFWNAVWLIVGLWPYERIRVKLTGNGESYSQVLSATSSGHCEIPTSAFEPYLLMKERMVLSIQRQGFVSPYELAVLSEVPTGDAPPSSSAPVVPTSKITERRVQKRKTADILEIVIYGARSDNMQKILIAEVEKLVNEDFGHLNGRIIEYPDSKRAPGRRLTLQRIRFDGLDSEDKDYLRAKTDSLVAENMEESGLDFRAEWSRRRE